MGYHGDRLTPAGRWGRKCCQTIFVSAALQPKSQAAQSALFYGLHHSSLFDMFLFRSTWTLGVPAAPHLLKNKRGCADCYPVPHCSPCAPSFLSWYAPCAPRYMRVHRGCSGAHGRWAFQQHSCHRYCSPCDSILQWFWVAQLRYDASPGDGSSRPNWPYPAFGSEERFLCTICEVHSRSSHGVYCCFYCLWNILSAIFCFSRVGCRHPTYKENATHAGYAVKAA